ncbi:MAG: NAD(P)H-binding protein [Lachnospiraceae bacterium]|nr:NAD(P)H-binding protein [Lachnospiraceae bacterium]
MKIGIIGATGREGRLITEEAVRRGHEVTAIVRNAEKAASLGVPVIEKDIFSLTSEDLKGFDAVVSAFGVPAGSPLAFQYETVGFTLTKLFEQLPDTRLLFVGGAASLYTDEKMKTRVIESGAIPEAYKAVPYHAWRSYMALQTSSVNWTYFSPALTFDPNGERTGSYTLGANYVIKNKAGESYISYQDYAIAMVDEIEQGRFIRKRFTAVSEHPGKESDAPEKSAAAPETPEDEGAAPEAPKPGFFARLFGRK